MPLFLIALAAGPAFAASVPAFDPRKHKEEIAGRPAEILVFGTMHLSQLPHAPNPAMLDSLINRLARFKPNVITIEGLSGEQCDVLHRFDVQHGGAWKDYCWDMTDVEKASGLTVSAAMAEIDRTLVSLPDNPRGAAAAPGDAVSCRRRPRFGDRPMAAAARSGTPRGRRTDEFDGRHDLAQGQAAQ